MTNDELRSWLSSVVHDHHEPMTSRLKAADLLTKMNIEQAKQEPTGAGMLRITWESPISEGISQGISQGISEKEVANGKEEATEQTTVSSAVNKGV